jgi:ribonucleotide reductase alpha subunit
MVPNASELETALFTPTGFSHTIFKGRYALTPDETWQEFCLRVARQSALAEKPEKMQSYEAKFLKILESNRFVPGGRICRNSGRTDPQLLNCFVLSNELDSKEGWGNITREMIITSMTGGGCVDADTEYFDGTTWHKICDYAGGPVAQYNNGVLEIIENPIYIKIPANTLTRFSTKYGVDQCLCDDHNVIFKDRDGSIQKMNFNAFKTWHENGGRARFITTFSTNRPGLPLNEWQIRLMVAFIADGTFYNRNTAGKIGIKKKRKQERLEYLFKSGNIQYKVHDWGKEVLAYTFELPLAQKHFEKTFYECSPQQLQWIIDECKHWDGLRPSDNRLGSFFTTNPGDRDFIQYAAHSTGLRASVTVDSTDGATNGYRVLFTERTEPGINGNFEPFNTRDGFKYCFNVPSHALVLRRNFNIFITGNCGIDFSDVRPDGSPIAGQGGTCPGPVSLMELIDNCAEPVRSGGSRRVALMFSLDLHHPDIFAFLNKKLELGKLTHANVSVRSHNTKDFVKAVRKNEQFEMSWKGKYKKQVSARELWNKIVENAYNCAEPGFLNWELVAEENNISYVTNLTTTNPCGEIPLENQGNCCLGHVVLPRFISSTGEVMWHEMAETIRLGVRFLDNVLTVNSYPLQSMKEIGHRHRRIGLGTTGLADMLALLNLRYASQAANKFVDQLYRFISKIAYEASVLLAVEKGPFQACDPQKHVESGFMRRMPKKIRSLVAEHGIRNCALLTVAPTGTVSILSNNCSSGIEPMFAPAYERRYWKDDKRETELVFHPLFAQFMEESRDVSHFVGAYDLTAREHMEVQKIVQKHIDNAVSKTINIPETYQIEELSELWLEYLPFLKGTTFYRQNTRGYVDSDGKVQEPPLVALSLEEAKSKFTVTGTRDSEVDCSSGVCEL